MNAVFHTKSMLYTNTSTRGVHLDAHMRSNKKVDHQVAYACTGVPFTRDLRFGVNEEASHCSGPTSPN